MKRRFRMPRRGLKYYPRCFTREQSIGGWAPYLYNGKFVVKANNGGRCFPEIANYY